MSAERTMIPPKARHLTLICNDAALPVHQLGNVPQLVEPDYSDEIDKKSDIIRAAVIYTARQGAFDGAFHADHTDNLVLAGGRVGDIHIARRDSALRRLTRHIRKAKSVRPVELWAVASVARVLLGEDTVCTFNPERFERDFLCEFFQLVENDCRSRARPASNVGGSNHDA